MADEIEHSGPVAFDAICALPGFCFLIKRSATLDGSLPLRAAQHCSPVLEGNAAGFQIVLQEPMTLRRTARGVAAELTTAASAILEGIPDALEALVRAGVLERDGYWHQVLRTGEFPIEGRRLRIWSGFLVRPRHGTWLRVTQAFNRGIRLPLVEHLVADPSGFTPLLLELDIRLLASTPSWLEGEIGCVLPVSPRVSLSLARLTRETGIAQSFEKFFDARYFAEKARRPTGKYRKLTREASAPASASDACAAEAFYLGPKVHAVQTLDRFCSPAGFIKSGPGGERGLPVGVVRNAGRLSGRWNGRAFTESNAELARASFQRAWRRAGGISRGDAFAFLDQYFFDPFNDEPYWVLQPWVFVRTSPGWSTVMDGCDVPGSTGMRGVTRSDIFHPLTMVYRLQAPQRFSIRAGAPLLRFHPLPRELQQAEWATIPL